MDRTHIFMCHSDSDAEIAKIFYDYLVKEMNIPPSMIFFSSSFNQIKNGEDFHLKIKKTLQKMTKKDIFFALLTDNFFESEFCCAEVGGAWIKDMTFILILVSPIKYNDKRIKHNPAFYNVQGMNIDIDDDKKIYEVLDKLKLDVCENSELKNVANTDIKAYKDYEYCEKIKAAVLQQLPHKVPIKLKQGLCNVYHGNVSVSSLNFEPDFDNNSFTLNVDFRNVEANDLNNQFAGFYIWSIENNWANYVRNNHYIIFDIASEGNVPNVIIEVKSNNRCIFEKEIKIKKNFREYRISLSEYSSLPDWNNIKEICFVFRPQRCPHAHGSIEISNLRLECLE